VRPLRTSAEYRLPWSGVAVFWRHCNCLGRDPISRCAARINFSFFPALKQCGQRISSNPADGGGTKPDRWGDEPPGHAATTRHGEAIKTIVSPWTNTPSEAIVVVDSSSPYLSAAVNPSAPLPLQVNHHSNLA